MPTDPNMVLDQLWARHRAGLRQPIAIAQVMAMVPTHAPASAGISPLLYALSGIVMAAISWHAIALVYSIAAMLVIPDPSLLVLSGGIILAGWAGRDWLRATRREALLIAPVALAVIGAGLQHCQ